MTTTNTKSLTTNINSFMKVFLSGTDISLESWTARDNQNQLRAILSGKELKKPKKDKSDKPKKSKSAYLFFCEDERKKITSENLGLKSVQVIVLLGQRWRDLKANKARSSELSKYEKLAHLDHERYTSEKQSAKKSSKKPDGNKHKSTYLLFCEQNRPVVKSELPNLKAKEIIVELARRWKLQKGE